MGSGSSKRSSPTSASKPTKAVVEEPKSNTASFPKQVDDLNDLLNNTKLGADGNDNVAKETDGPSGNDDKMDAFLTEVPEPWLDILNEVADSELWPGGKRSERPEWQEFFTKADELAKSPKKELSLKTKTAIYSGELVIPDLPDMNKKVLVFVSSTFTDTKAERNNLMKDVYPYVREICRRLGLEFGTIDMRWGVTDEATKHHATVKMCVDEIQRCIKESCGPAFLCILSHKYGYRPIPATIEESEYEMILAYLINNNQDASLLKTFYRLDKNALEQEYVLRSMRDDEDKDQWWKDIEVIQEQIRQAAVECFHGKPDICSKYFVSVTEMEIQSGAFKNLDRDNQSCFMIRELRDIENKIHHHRRLRDMKGSEVDKDANERLQFLIQKKLPEKVRHENIHTFNYSYVNVKGGMQSVRQFCDQACRKIIGMIFDSFEKKGNIENDTDVVEIVQHLKLAEEKRRLFVGREKELTEIKRYFTGKTGGNKPLVISGSSGSGKTALMAVSAGKAKEIFKNSVVIVRFIGTTSQSGSVRSLLLSICKQIAHAYFQDVALIPDSTRELADYFRNALNNATKTTPLIIHLDSLDQLSSDDNGRKLDWLKLDANLPKHVKVVLSSLEADTLYVLQKHLPQENIVHVMKLLPGEGPEILQKMMKCKGRKITEPQMKLVMNAFLNTPLPLYLSLAADIASRLKSYDNIEADDISPTIKGMITILFERLENMFGKIFVQHALAYITASKHGLSQNELEDILSCDDVVLDSLFQYWTPPMRRMPPLLWTRVRHELGQYLSERGSDGVTVLTWFHRQFSETAKERYLNTSADSDMNHNAHSAIADYFDSKWVGGKEYISKGSKSKASVKPVVEDRGLPEQPLVYGNRVKGFQNINRRKIRELPYHLLKLGDMERFSKLFLDLKFVETKFEAGMGHEYYSELTDGAKIAKAGNLIRMVRFIGSNLSFLLREPLSIYQLASQQLEHHPARQQLTKLHEIPTTVIKNTTLSDDTSNEVCELTLQGHKESPLSCDFSPKGDKIVSTSTDGCLRIWDVLTGSEVAVYTSLPSSSVPDDKRTQMNMLVHSVNPCCFSRDGETIALGTEEAEIVLFDCDGTKLKSEPTENDRVTCIQFSPDNKSIATGFMNGKLYISKAETLEHCGTLQLEHEILDLDFSPDGDMLAVVCRTGLARIKTEPLTFDWFTRNMPGKGQRRNERRALRPELVLCGCYHPGGRRIMTGSADNHIGIWDASKGVCLQKLGEHPAWIWSIKITKDGTYMFSASSDRSIKLWKSTKEDVWEVVSTFYGHSHRVVCLAVDKNTESRLVSASLDCKVKRMVT
ncbi:NACHT and WD repeat domain-containing protein 2-like isoform X2 [Mercenaria mercenaria]|uniref:NACHT and WD repeat domain-containing protein 2-like isoform X2 n=1 Tax=Mercenaria mercenaria TaxID=6596 RepID=UPI00234E48DE|nr:NACHT and WD repeat domain-containing protein 2-like isoform X2 [Mercenaria mercenaria]